MGGAHPTRTFWVSPTLRCPWTALGFGSGTAFCGFGFVFCGYGCAHLTRTGVVPHLTRTSLLRVVNAFGHRHVWGSCRSALLSTSPPSVVTPSLPRRSILVKGGDSAFDRALTGGLCVPPNMCVTAYRRSSPLESLPVPPTIAYPLCPTFSWTPVKIEGV